MLICEPITFMISLSSLLAVYISVTLACLIFYRFFLIIIIVITHPSKTHIFKLLTQLYWQILAILLIPIANCCNDHGL